MKKAFVPFVCILSILLVLLNVNTITDHIILILNPVSKASYIKQDIYNKNNYNFVENTTSNTPFGKQDILNIFYTVLNDGMSSFTFYCPKEYTNCISDISEMSKDENLLTHLNNFVHPYHSFSNITTDISDSGEINLKINYIYSKEEIDSINKEVERLIKELLDSSLTEDYDKIKVIHDYIINNTKYDLDNKEENKSFTAYGALFNHLATCNGYTDLMAIFLAKMGYDNYKIATTNDSSGHVWNVVKINKEWLHLDLTWDDPVSSDGKDYLYHKYFLINTDELIIADNNITSKEHEFDRSIYSELKATN